MHFRPYPFQIIRGDEFEMTAFRKIDTLVADTLESRIPPSKKTAKVKAESFRRKEATKPVNPVSEAKPVNQVAEPGKRKLAFANFSRLRQLRFFRHKLPPSKVHGYLEIFGLAAVFSSTLREVNDRAPLQSNHYVHFTLIF
jgi:hypothetical protein